MKLLTVAQICPDPAILKLTDDLQGWNSDHPLFKELIDKVQPKTIIEVGSYKGRSALHMAGLTANLGTSLYCCDTWLGDGRVLAADLADPDKSPCNYGGNTTYFQFLHNISAGGCADRVYPVLQTSVGAARILDAFQIKADLIYIDGDHHYEQVFMDLEFYSQLLTENGIMFGDDFRDFPGVRMGVTRFAFEHGFKVITSGPAWVLEARKS